MKLLQLQYKLSRIYNYKYFCTKSNKILSSKQIRKSFLDFFIESHKHKFVKSSPVIPLCDPTLAFVNAGMNQFKPIFLGKVVPTDKRVTNSQKCIRVGGKHNDISIVGKDGYHHTFFEMLGNWSFGDYFKEEACKMALGFLKDSLKIDTSRLYVTYFGGDEKLNIPADLECYEIWKSLGFKDDRILPFGSKENFWEMGLTGPCGPCTEIHIDHLSSNENRSKYVNAGRDDLTELWNLVFIQYNRNPDGSITSLPQRHVDTGMGMERLTAVIQGKRSNYDTDLFSPIIDKISKLCGTTEYKGIFNENDKNYQLDSSYRIVADHSRMITACLSDGMLPDQNQKLRRIIRTIISLSENVFHNENLINETIPIVIEILGSTYPEMKYKYENILDILKYEKELFKQLRLDASKDIQKEILTKYPKLSDEIDIIDYPGFINAFKEFQQLKHTFNNNVIPGRYLFKLRDTYGLNNDIIERIAEIENFQLDYDGLKMEILKAKQKFKSSLYSGDDNQNHVSSIIECATKLLNNQTATSTTTNDHYKYNYEFNKNLGVYNVPNLEAKILKIFEKDHNIRTINSNSKNMIGIVTDKSNFYYESGGQESDRGIIRINNDHNGNVVDIEINQVEKINDFVIHIGKFIPNNLNYEINVNDNVNLIVNNNHRTYNIFHHTGTHLLNASIRNLFKKVTYQISSSITSKHLKFELGIIGKKLLLDDINSIERLIKNIISSSLPIEIRTINALKMLDMPDIITVPGEIYPESDLRLIQIKDNNNDRNSFISKELCCGTHAINTSELSEFCLVNFKQISRIKYAFTAVCGNLAKQALSKSEENLDRINILEQKFRNDPEHFDKIEKDVKKLKNELLHGDDNNIQSYILKMECLDKINDLSKMIKEFSRSNLKNFVEIEMTNILQQCPKETHPFIIYFLKISSLIQAVPLQKATKVCSDRPILVISLDDGKIKARCCVPADKVSDKFSAIRWLQEFSDVFQGQISPPKGQNPNEVCNMKAKKVISSLYHDQLDLAIKRAREYAKKYL